MPSRTRLADLDRPYDVLLDELLTRWGDDARIAFYYDADHVALAHVRDDLLDRDLVPHVDEVATRARRRDEQPTERSQDALGARETTVEIREDALVVHFHGADDEGLVVVADRGPSVFESMFDE
ncbi:hypothetical protein [Halanaeroarchaeum sp. HSR-CO]|uniref:hypothetical protein n=1 Tax=Halanaeroarchaeum sp. HSR-CO TaxID=2866382 RepID=UPI00217E1B7A|nr:hypothetical protein [Halanaeroarchaeum sp. HSR-CO]